VAAFVESFWIPIQDIQLIALLVVIGAVEEDSDMNHRCAKRSFVAALNAAHGCSTLHLLFETQAAIAWQSRGHELN
jgi:hypothetical protein